MIRYRLWHARTQPRGDTAQHGRISSRSVFPGRRHHCSDCLMSGQYAIHAPLVLTPLSSLDEWKRTPWPCQTRGSVARPNDVAVRLTLALVHVRTFIAIEGLIGLSSSSLHGIVVDFYRTRLFHPLPTVICHDCFIGITKHGGCTARGRASVRKSHDLAGLELCVRRCSTLCPSLHDQGFWLG